VWSSQEDKHGGGREDGSATDDEMMSTTTTTFDKGRFFVMPMSTKADDRVNGLGGG